MTIHDRKFYIESFESDRSGYIEVLRRINETADRTTQNQLDLYFSYRNKLDTLFRLFGVEIILLIIYTSYFWNEIMISV